MVEGPARAQPCVATAGGTAKPGTERDGAHELHAGRASNLLLVTEITMGTSFATIDLETEAERLFCEMAETALEADPKSERMFMLAVDMEGNQLVFVGDPQRTWTDVDRGALDDFVELGLLRKGFGSGRARTPNYRLRNDGRRYHQWLQQERGQPMDQVEEAVTEWLDGERFAARYPRASVSLGKAFAALWSGDQGDQTVSSMGGDLRSGLQEFTDELLERLALESATSPEKPLERLDEAVRAVADRVGPRETAVLEQLVELTRAIWKQTQRLTHVRDEEEPLAGWDELRRTGFVVAMVVHELDRAVG